MPVLRATRDARGGVDGGPLRTATRRTRVWRPAVAQAGLEPPPTPHAALHEFGPDRAHHDNDVARYLTSIRGPLGGIY